MASGVERCSNTVGTHRATNMPDCMKDANIFCGSPGRSAVAGRLEAEDAGIDPLPRHHLGVRPTFRDPPLGEHDDVIGHPHRREVAAQALEAGPVAARTARSTWRSKRSSKGRTRRPTSGR